MKVLLFVDSLAGGYAVDAYLKSFDANGRNGFGRFVFTRNIDDALRFDGAGSALECWRTQSIVRPLRDDGRPNRPLTAFTVSFIGENDAAAFLSAAIESRQKKAEKQLRILQLDTPF